MARRRSNPWPAFADLFAALLVATFAGLMAMSQELGDEGQSGKSVGQLEQEIGQLEQEIGELEADVQTLTAERETLEHEKRQLEAEVDSQEQQIATLTSDLDRLQTALEAASFQIDSMAKSGRGIDPPPCLWDRASKRIQPLLGISIFDDGLEVSGLLVGRDRVSNVDGLDQLLRSGRINGQTFSRRAEATKQWGRRQSNLSDRGCVFYARIDIRATSAEAVSGLVAWIDDAFYLSNPSEVDAFLKRQ